MKQVRAAAVYALGTFINSVMERSDHANTIDLSVVMALVSTVSGDMSSLVRRELVKAVQWVILAFEHTFINVASQENVIFAHDSARHTPTSMRRIGSRLVPFFTKIRRKIIILWCIMEIFREF